MKKYIGIDLSLLFKRTFTFSLFVLCPLLCAASYYEFLQDYSIGQTPISPTWILFNIVTVLYYLVHWQLKSTFRCGARVFFDFTNVFFSEACIWLSALMFLSTDPFIDVNEDCIIDPFIYKIFGFLLLIVWSIFVFLQMVLNTIIHVIVVYHCYRRKEERMLQYTFMARTSIGIVITISRLITISGIRLLVYPSLYDFVFAISQTLLVITGHLNHYHLGWGKEPHKKNQLTKCVWISKGVFAFFQLTCSFMFISFLIKALPQMPFNVHNIRFDVQMLDETNLNQCNTGQSFNFLPFIACIHLYSTIREFLLKLRIEDEVSRNFLSQSNARNNDGNPPKFALEQRYSDKSGCYWSSLKTTNGISLDI